MQIKKNVDIDISEDRMRIWLFLVQKIKTNYICSPYLAAWKFSPHRFIAEIENGQHCMCVATRIDGTSWQWCRFICSEGKSYSKLYVVQNKWTNT